MQSANIAAVELETFIHQTAKFFSTFDPTPENLVALKKILTQNATIPVNIAYLQIFAKYNPEPVWQLFLEENPTPESISDTIKQLFILLPEKIEEITASLLKKLNETQLAEYIKTLIKTNQPTLAANLISQIRLVNTQLSAATKATTPAAMGKILLEILITAPPDFITLGDALNLTGDFFRSDIFRIRKQVLLIAIFLQSLAVKTTEQLTRNFPEILNVFEPVNNWLKNNSLVDTGIKITAFLNILIELLKQAANNELAEFALLELTRLFPLGFLLPLLQASLNIAKISLPWPGLLFQNVVDHPDFKTKVLPAPGPGTKYLIFSDQHRDQASDDKGVFEFGSINHFSHNAEQYLRILQWADKDGWTVIENGDCDELWAIRNFEDFYKKNFQAGLIENIILTYPKIYSKLGTLSRKGRYFRLLGNHDACVRRPEILSILKKRLRNKNFEVYDFAVIPEVKTMDEHDKIELALDLAKMLQEPNPGEKLREILKRHIGLDSGRYENKKQMIIAHGHQWDFWNCDENSLVGKMFTNSLGVWADSINDPLLDLGGIGIGGSPILKFGNLLNNIPAFNSYPSSSPALKQAHQIQHQDDADRILLDDVYYLESLVALMTAFTMPLDLPDAKFSETLAAVRKKQLPVKALFPHLLNHICIGHTHYPASMPYLNLNGWIDSRPVQALIGQRFEQLNEILSELLFGYEIDLNIFKMRYHNSGTTGMHEGVIWAIQIDESGQPRLVYWTNNTKPDQPFTMDWDIPPMPEQTKEVYEAKFESVVNYFSGIIAPELLHPDRPRTLGTTALTLETFTDNLDFDTLAISSVAGSTPGQVLLDIFLKLLNNQINDSGSIGELALAQIDNFWTSTQQLISGLNLDGTQIDNLTGIWYLLTNALPGNNLRSAGADTGNLSALYLNLVLPFLGNSLRSNFTESGGALKFIIDFLKK